MALDDLSAELRGVPETFTPWFRYMLHPHMCEPTLIVHTTVHGEYKSLLSRAACLSRVFDSVMATLSKCGATSELYTVCVLNGGSNAAPCSLLIAHPLVDDDVGKNLVEIEVYLGC